MPGRCDIVHELRLPGQQARVLVALDTRAERASRSVLRISITVPRLLPRRAMRAGRARCAARLHCLHDVLVARTATEIAGEAVADLVLARVRVFLQERQQGHQDAGRAEAALQAVRFPEGLLQRM